jgi:D-sedoheptulose 7-phosphate isomerase
MTTRDGARLADAAFAAAIALHGRMRLNLGPALVAAQAMSEALGAGRKLLVFGNGGSAADAQHIAAEFVGRFQLERDPLPALALSVNTSALTAIANDYGYEEVFARQLRGLGSAGDVALGISTSGRSPNVNGALSAARAMGMGTIGLTGGSGGDMRALCDHCIVVPADDTPRIQEGHILVAHVLCEIVETALFAGG